MIKIGIRAHDMGKMDAKSLFEEANNFGFDGIQLVVNKALVPEPQLTKEAFEELNAVKNTNVFLLGSYFNPIHSDLQKIETGMNRFFKQLELASILNTEYVATETGSYNDDQWTYHVNNHTEEAYQKVLSKMRILVKKAEEVNRTVLIEAAFGHVIYKASVLKRLVLDLNSKHVGVIVDLYNLLNLENYTEHESILEDALITLKPYIKVFHLKNYIYQDNKLVQTGLHRGEMNYQRLLPLMVKSNPNAYYIFEGITGEDIKDSLCYIKKILEEKNEI
ncbi:sugar phosphate isomerase/epimerase [Acholeplasma morum]|uniref:sugar phosphate isomerase/epimerase family protein n=1 Tax=Paracholeplasma morum TaxID=264637 RepID=UPI00195AA599|nr:sugar phosphate isomerase/epimerase [Paracholeplasma morum]MBM7453254.1 sugar phosphate isomerase/epimerase [Paracholeplasma morum]